jgi:4-hydroxy-tetrahydrodipicolinate synthase
VSEAPPRAPLRARIGTSAALATPFGPDGAVDWPAFAAHASALLARGLEVVTVFGTTGEGASVPREVRTGLCERMSALGVPATRLVECVYATAAEDAGAAMRRSLAAGVAGILLPPPFYFKGVSEDGVFRWFAAAIEAAGPDCRDVLLYSIPQLTGVAIGAGLTGRLREAYPGAIAGVKDSGGDWAHTAALVRAHSDLAILVGNEDQLAQAVRLGASGAISGVANFAPELVQRLVTGADDARIGPLLARLLAHPLVPAIKAVLAAQTGRAGWIRVRPPLEPLAPAAGAALAAEVAPLAA